MTYTPPTDDGPWAPDTEDVEFCFVGATAAAYREGIRDGLTAAAHIACAEQTTARQDADLTASQCETGHEDQYETDFNRWLDSLSPGQREQITRDIEAAHDLIRDGLTAAAHIARQEQP